MLRRHLSGLRYVINPITEKASKLITPKAKKTWRGCGSHIPSALAGVPEDQWCTCSPRVTVGGKAYPPAARFDFPGYNWLSSFFGGGKPAQKGDGPGKEDL